ncbi:uncharacterized protein LOC114316594 [Camellia sinensis]|uniref:uncharacterized protein LOC114316594 n=1 Tax=Camellia sinensis TaxID=4442 RepID=UPI001036EAFF|nr:uncharacterized protein LOC114316594 [Camellia sinensis]
MSSDYRYVSRCVIRARVDGLHFCFCQPTYVPPVEVPDMSSDYRYKPTMVLMREIKDDRGGFGQRRSWWKQTTTNMCFTSSPLATEPLTYYRQSSDLWWCLRWKEKEEEGFCNGEWICRFVNSFSEPFLNRLR